MYCSLYLEPYINARDHDGQVSALGMPQIRYHGILMAVLKGDLTREQDAVLRWLAEVMLRYRQEGPQGGQQSTGANVVKITPKSTSSRALTVWRLLLDAALLVLFVISFAQLRQERAINLNLQAINEELRRDLNDIQSLMQAELQSNMEGTEAATKPEEDIMAMRRLEDAQKGLESKNSLINQLNDKVKNLERIGKYRDRELNRTKLTAIECTRAECVRRFPSGPAHVLMHTSEGDIEIEMAPCHLMPVVTMHFIRQVEQGFWDGMVFFRAESHVIQATDMHPDGARISHKRSESIPFQEYSTEFVHHKYTLGIAGRPGGPDFYINMLDNRRIHGPGGQGHNYQGNPDSDSCFAKIVQGTDVGDRIQKLPFKREGGLHILQTPVEIIKMTLL